MNLRKDHYRLLVFADLLKTETPSGVRTVLPSGRQSEPRSVGLPAVARNVSA